MEIAVDEAPISKRSVAIAIKFQTYVLSAFWDWGERCYGGVIMFVSNSKLHLISFDGDGHSFRINRTGGWNRFPILLALQDVEPNSVQHAGLCLFY